VLTSQTATDRGVGVQHSGDRGGEEPAAVPRTDAAVPTLCTNASIRPAVCTQISSARAW
jgi:hypothetical protein